MNVISTLRRQQRTSARYVLSLFVVALLGVTMQPCAMAIEIDMSAEPQLVDTASQHHPDSSKDALQATERPCSHCPPGQMQDGGPCDQVVASQCADLPDIKQSDRNSTQAPAEPFAYVALPGLVAGPDAPDKERCKLVLYTSGVEDLDPTPIRLQLCVFLK